MHSSCEMKLWVWEHRGIGVVAPLGVSEELAGATRWGEREVRSEWPSSARVELRRRNLKQIQESPPVDCMQSSPLVISERLSAFLAQSVTIELLPVNLGFVITDQVDVDSDEGSPTTPIEGRYFIANVVRRLRCLDVERSGLSWNDQALEWDWDEDSPPELDPERPLPSDVRLFRLEELPHVLIVRQDLAEEILREGFQGAQFRPLEELAAIGGTRLAAPTDAKKLPALPGVRVPIADSPREPPSSGREALEKHFALRPQQRYKGMRAPALPSFSSPAELKFYARPPRALFAQNEIDEHKYAAFVPFASIPGHAEFLIADTSSPGLPVLMWEHEAGEFEPVATNLSGFLETLVRS